MQEIKTRPIMQAPLLESIRQNDQLTLMSLCFVNMKETAFTNTKKQQKNIIPYILPSENHQNKVLPYYSSIYF
jgi:hypothetical protein